MRQMVILSMETGMQVKGNKSSGVKNYSSNKVMRNLTEEMAFQQRPEGGGGENSVVI